MPDLWLVFTPNFWWCWLVYFVMSGRVCHMSGHLLSSQAGETD